MNASEKIKALILEGFRQHGITDETKDEPEGTHSIGFSVTALREVLGLLETEAEPFNKEKARETLKQEAEKRGIKV